MSIRALEVGTANILLWGNVPTTATLIRDEGQVEVGGHILDEERVVIDRVKAIGDRKG